MPPNVTTLYLETAATCFGRLQPYSGHERNIYKIMYNATCIYLPYASTIRDPASLQYLSQYEIVKSSCIVADGCKIIIGLGKMCNNKIKILNFKLKL